MILCLESIVYSDQPAYCLPASIKTEYILFANDI